MSDPDAHDDPLRVRTDHPGGNGCVLEIDYADDGTTVRLEPERRDSTVRWFAWNVRFECEDARDVTVEFPHDEAVGLWGPAIRSDGSSLSAGSEPESGSEAESEPESDSTWKWLGSDRRIDASRFEYSFEAGERIQFAFSFPYQQADLDAFASEHGLTLESVAKTTAGRDIPLFRLGPSTSDRHLIVACRHHACESIASYVLEGFVRSLRRRDPTILDDENYQIHVFPMVDLDGVERGDPGKHRAPHDHNRDYTTSNAVAEFDPLYPATAAIMEYVRTLEGTVSFGLDLHCPYKWGDLHDRPFFVTEPETMPDGLERLATALETETYARDDRTRPAEDDSQRTLTFDASPDSGLSTFDGSSARVPAFIPFLWTEGAALAATFEVPYAGTDANPVTPTTARDLGTDLARALAECLE